MTYANLFISQYLEEFRVPCSAVVLIYLNEEVLLLHSSFSHQQFFFLSIALVLSPHFIFKSLFLARHTFSLLFLCVYVCEGWNNPESALVFPHTVLEPLVNMNVSQTPEWSPNIKATQTRNCSWTTDLRSLFWLKIFCKNYPFF